MDHNNKHLLPGFQFPTAFAGLANVGAGANASLLSALSHLSTLPTTLLPTTINPTELAQWAAAAQQTNQQAWLDQAKVAAMLPSLYLSSVADMNSVKNLALAQQSLQASVVNSTSSSSIFPNLMKTITTQHLMSPKKEAIESPSAVEPLSNASSSHQSTSTPQEIDVGVFSTPPAAVSFDFTAKIDSPAPKITESIVDCEPSSSTSTTTTMFSTSVKAATAAPLSRPHAIGTSTTSAFTKRNHAIQRSHSERASSSSSQHGSTSGAPLTAPLTKRNPDNPDGEEHEEEELFFNSLQQPEQEDVNAGAFGLFDTANNGGGWSPVQFTPPDSPTGGEHSAQEKAKPSAASAVPIVPTSTPRPPSSLPSVASTTPRPTNSVNHSPFKTPMPTIKQPIKRPPFTQKQPPSKSTKVPIYKQKRIVNSYKLDTVTDKTTGEDAYSFEDEEENSITKLDPKDRLDQDVREKLSKLASQGGDKNKNVYVPGVGFAVPQEQPQQDLWRNVVLKKRPVENRPAIPSANLLPASVHAEACQAAARLAEPEIVTLAESLRRRKRARYVCHYIKTEGLPQNSDNSTFKEEGSDLHASYVNNAIAVPKLPKLVIKLPRKSTEESYEKKKKKKRKREEDDSDWEGDKKTRKHKNKKIKKERRDSGYEIRLIEQEGFDYKQPSPLLPLPVKEEIPMEPFNRKKKLMQQWQEEERENLAKVNQENGQLRYNGVQGIQPINRSIPVDAGVEAIKQRLNKFSQADGHITKGCFVVNKSELFRDDCALWKVDNPNMLQKFPPKIDPTTKNITYKSSSTYSGWCEQISSGYYKVTVRFIKQSRSESIVEPEVPLADLFPAMTSELTNDKNGVIVLEEETKTDLNEQVNILRDQKRMSLVILNREIVDHALNLEHLQTLREKNDWNFLKALTDVEKVNADCMHKLRSTANMAEEYEDLIKDYSKMVVSETEKEISGFISLNCQACKNDKRPVAKIIQLLGRQGYDRETLQYANKVRTKPNDEDEEEQEPLIATELYFCDSCATAAQNFHRCYHMLFDLLRYAEDKMELFGTLYSEYKPETIVEMAKKSRNWQNKIFTDIIDMWKKIETSSGQTSIPSLST